MDTSNHGNDSCDGFSPNFPLIDRPPTHIMWGLTNRSVIIFLCSPNIIARWAYFVNVNVWRLGIPLYSLLLGVLRDVGEVAEVFVVVETVADCENIGNGEQRQVGRELDQTARWLVEQCHNVQ